MRCQPPKRERKLSPVWPRPQINICHERVRIKLSKRGERLGSRCYRESLKPRPLEQIAHKPAHDSLVFDHEHTTLPLPHDITLPQLEVFHFEQQNCSMSDHQRRSELRQASLPALLYAEDDAEIAEMTIEMLSDDYAVEHVTRGDEALDRALHHSYRAMVFDRRLPGKDGLELVRAVRTARIATPILLLTALGDIHDRVEGLDAGANDYLVKPFAYEELFARLRALQRGANTNSSRREIGPWVLVPATQALYSPTGERITLTETETALLDALAASPEHIFTRDELLGAVFHPVDSSVGAGSVETYVHYVRRKSTPEIIETVRGRGYRLGVPA